MSRHTVNIDRDQARLYDLIWKRTLASQMSDAKLERTNVKIEANNHSEIFTASEVLFEFLKCTWKVMMTMKKSKRECYRQ
jgi:DNA topoisomerase-1